MPWRTPDLVSIREEFVEQAISGRYPVAALCNAYGISEKTGHKWLNRFKEEGRPGLSDRSRAPHETPHKISLEVRRAILALREKHPTWGPKKLRVVLRRKVPEKHWPAPSSIGELLRREGCVRPQRRRNTGTGLPIDAGLTVARAPNDVWSTDFKGPVPPHKRRALLSAHRSRRVQSLRDRHHRTQLDSLCTSRDRLHEAFPGIRTAQRDSQRQRSSIREPVGDRASFKAFRLVDPPWHSSRTNSAGRASAERHARANAQDPQGRCN